MPPAAAWVASISFRSLTMRAMIMFSHCCGANLSHSGYATNCLAGKIQLVQSRTVIWNWQGPSPIMMFWHKLLMWRNVPLITAMTISRRSTGNAKALQLPLARQPIFFDYKDCTRGFIAMSPSGILFQDISMLWLIFYPAVGSYLTTICLLISIFIFHRSILGAYATSRKG